jgi:hypothetical protein
MTFDQSLGVDVDAASASHGSDGHPASELNVANQTLNVANCGGLKTRLAEKDVHLEHFVRV